MDLAGNVPGSLQRPDVEESLESLEDLIRKAMRGAIGIDPLLPTLMEEQEIERRFKEAAEGSKYPFPFDLGEKT